MFETATFESAGAIHTRSRSWMLATLALNSTVLLALILIPLIYPNALPDKLRNLTLTVPPPPSAPAQQIASHAPAQLSPSPQMAALPTLSATQPSRLNFTRSGATDTPGGCTNCASDSLGTGIGAIPGGDPLSHTLTPSAPPRVVKPKGPLAISTGVAAGMLVAHPEPTYPAIAKAAGIQGTVVLEAVISKTGTIQGIRVLSGHPMLRQAALDAVQQWRYRPYLLSGEPVEVETTINVIFTLGR